MQRSPFTAMSPREQQERWLEFQSIRLPYCRCACEQDTCEEETPERTKPCRVEAPKRPQPCPEVETHCVKGGSAKECGYRDCQCGQSEEKDCECTCKEKPHCAVPQPPRECNVKPRYRQYDAVIERMNAACRNAYPYRSASD